jgi:hypothetical protein
MGLEKDLPPGAKLVACFRPFLEDWIQGHVDNLWAQGGEIIRDLHVNPSLVCFLAQKGEPKSLHLRSGGRRKL